MCSTEVKETEKMYTISEENLSQGFGFRSWLYKTECCISEHEAFKKERDRLGSEIMIFEKRLRMAEDQMIELEKLNIVE